jgi:Sulfotransferase family
VSAPFFIVGNDRSGTTLLRLILDSGPDAAIPPESMFLTDVELDGDARAREPQQLLDALWRHPKVRLWELPPAPPRVPPGLERDEAMRFVLGAPFAAYAARFGKARWGDKTPHYVHHVDRLLGVWPEARVVVLVRDGRDVALSLRRMPFGPNNAWAAAQWWARGVRAGLEAQARHPGSVAMLRYEDLVRDPAAEVARVCEFLGLRFQPDMLEIERADPRLIVDDQRSWFPTLFDGITTASVERWRREMAPRDQGVFASLAGAELAQLGYPVPLRAPRPVTPRHARLYHRHNEVMRNVNFVRLRVVQERGRELRVALRRRLQDPVRRGQRGAR